MIGLDMEMPKSCDACRFKSDMGIATLSYCNVYWCSVINGSVKYPDHKNSRVPVCPLIPMVDVPESVYDKLYDDATQNRKE